jgi:hypothetical protein
MKRYEIAMPASEAERIRPQVQNMMQSTRPIIFRDRYGRFFVLVHGLKNRGFIDWTEESLRNYVETHSNLKVDETIYIISCFSATNVLHDHRNKMYINTEFPIFISGVNVIDEYDGLFSFTIITDDVNEIPIFARHLAMALSISEEKATAIINGEED